MSVRALLREADLRRLAKVACAERVNIRSHVAVDGSVTIHMSPAARTIDDDPGDLDRRLDEFGAS
jgi:hypothetical protein